MEDNMNLLNGENWEFSTENNSETNSVGILDRMMNPKDALKKLAQREEDIVDFSAGNSKDMGLDYIPADKDSEKRGGVYILKHSDFGPQGMELDKTALKSACKMMKTDISYFNQFPDSQNKFVKDFRSFIDHKGHGVMIRTGTSRDGINRRVESFVPTTFNRVSDNQIFGAMLTRLQNDYGDNIRGVQFLDDQSRGTSNYRVVFGNTMMHEDPRDPTKAVIPMLSFISSEHNLVDSRVALGLYRIYCRNGMMRTDWEGGIAKWNRRNSPNQFVKKIGDIIGNVGHFSTAVANTLGTRMNMPLAMPALEILYGLHSRGLIGRKHFEAAELIVPCSPCSTEYDFLNILTDSAKNLNPLTARQEAESKAMRLAMQPNGFSGIMIDGFQKDSSHVGLATK